MELTELRFQMEACRHDRSGRRRFHESLKAEIASYVRSRRQAGEDIQHLSESLGVCENQLYRWMRRFREPATGFLPVRFVEPSLPEPSEPVPEVPPALRLVSPSGWIIEGLDLQTLSVLLLRLP